jgi:hypothetical protein
MQLVVKKNFVNNRYVIIAVNSLHVNPAQGPVAKGSYCVDRVREGNESHARNNKINSIILVS